MAPAQGVEPRCAAARRRVVPPTREGAASVVAAQQQAPQEFTLEQVEKATLGGPALVVFEGAVYNITSVLTGHPGGEKARRVCYFSFGTRPDVVVPQLLRAHVGTDITSSFHGHEGVRRHAHSPAARRALEPLRVGVLGPGPLPVVDGAAAWEPASAVDCSRAIVPQVGKLGARYHEWLRYPILSTEPLRMFDSWFLETFSKTPWWTVPLLWLPLWCWSLWWAVVPQHTPPALMPPLLSLGLLAWSLLEYTLHRFVFHAQPTRPLAIMLHYSLHGCHHKQPGDRLRLVFPPLFAAPLVAFFWHACRAAMGGLRGPGATVFAGMLLGYVFYDMSHYAMHRPGAAPKWLRRARRTHLAHHYVDEMVSFGVSSDLMDRIWGTQPKATRMKK